MNSLTVGIDISKQHFHCVFMNAHGKVVKRKHYKRTQLLAGFRLQEEAPLTIIIEACGSASYWARELETLGHQVKLIPPQHVIAFRRKGKNDYNDAEAIAEAGQRANMTFAQIKTIEQQEMQSLIKIRHSLVRQQVQISNQIRGHLAEFGLILNQGHRAINVTLMNYLEDAENALPFRLRQALFQLKERYNSFQQEIDRLEKEISAFSQTTPECEQLQTIPGVGPIIAATVFSTIGAGQEFKNGREFAAYLGIVPKQNSTGGKTTLGHITKKGNRFLRQLLVHGARSVLWSLAKKPKTDRFSSWAMSLQQRTHWNKACVAIANKLARIIWAVVSHGKPYQTFEIAA